MQRGYFDGGWKDVGGDGISFDLGGRINLKGREAETAGGPAELFPRRRDGLTCSVDTLMVVGRMLVEMAYPSTL